MMSIEAPAMLVKLASCCSLPAFNAAGLGSFIQSCGIRPVQHKGRYVAPIGEGDARPIQGVQFCKTR